MKNKNLVAAQSFLLIASPLLMLSAYSYADNKDKIKPLKGCYQVIRGSMEESAADAKKVIGTYHFSLSRNDPGRPRNIKIAGPISGSEASDSHEEGEIHGGHVLGTYDRTGTLSSNEDDLVITGASCLDEKGQPRLITGIETLKFNKGTGIYAGLTHGSITFNLTFDACTDTTNPVADLKAVSGEICFKE
ncbi:MAG: hypothetical protein ACOY4D_06545 [Pseudomonadota bacterium]